MPQTAGLMVVSGDSAARSLLALITIFISTLSVSVLSPYSDYVTYWVQVVSSVQVSRTGASVRSHSFRIHVHSTPSIHDESTAGLSRCRCVTFALLSRSQVFLTLLCILVLKVGVRCECDCGPFAPLLLRGLLRSPCVLAAPLAWAPCGWRTGPNTPLPPPASTPAACVVCGECNRWARST